MVSPSVIKQVQALIQQNRVFIASKTYCPYCQAAKRTLLEEKRVPASAVKLLELDTMGEEGAVIQAALQELSGQRTVPNIYINGRHVGGNSDLEALKASGELDQLLEEALRE
ncbi:AFR710Wp [Eremothecium gossypii ATCC 10895]|uniref:AFR710Wp n=1 Tax=Eremothecium gossypii (strain ATCC 10895 / CBS 109.51 / FGSC 9923 / NRRL Y-1056) TaxID=284811 RepID=Q751W5_EREGS|nr:AFR710Wp [Eremothecium gossypii ATCC 10895]AAS54082.1 AFR710Wp [Eremothecium gossypii ATCC 10895]AEY98397.1 FAFR710Wp [Eremothecium gossypii FDAG1]